MDKDSLRGNNINNANVNNTNGRETTIGGSDASLLLRASSETIRQTTSSDFVLQWGNRKRLRCMKVQVKDNNNDSAAPVHRNTVRVDRRVVRVDKDSSNQPASANHSNGFLNLRQRPSSPPPPPSQRILRYIIHLLVFFLTQVCEYFSVVVAARVRHATLSCGKFGCLAGWLVV